MSGAAAFGAAACLLQAAAFAAWAAQARRAQSRPRAAVWRMWACGAAAAFALGLQVGAPPAALVAPAAAAIAAIAAATQAWARAPHRPAGTAAWVALGAEAALTAGFVAFLLLAAAAKAPVRGPGLAFVGLAALPALTSAWPVLRAAYAAPREARPLAWLLASAAWGLMSLATMAGGLPWPFLVYPVLSQVLTLLAGLLAIEAGDAPSAAGTTA
jgi:hypothetical protein